MAVVERWPLLEVRLYILGNRMVLQVVDGKDYAQMWKCSMLQGLLARKEEDFSTRKILGNIILLGLHAEIAVCVVTN